MRNHILFISTATTSRVVNSVFKNSGRNPGFSIQNYYNMLIDGFTCNNMQVEVLSKPVAKYSEKHLLPPSLEETENNVHYKYIKPIRSSLISRAYQLFASFIYTLFWCVRNRGKGIIFCDTLKVTICIGSLLATKLTFTKSVGMITDMPGMTGIGSGTGSIGGLWTKLHLLFLPYFSGFVLISEHTNKVINKYNKPYIIMEGLVRDQFDNNVGTLKKNKYFTFLYAGGLAKEYGLEMLVKAFKLLKRENLRLVIYGSGPYEDELKRETLSDPRIEYRGVALNEVIVEEEKKATILVNPRLTTGEFTKYSFPGKNMEYMLSGTPTLTTKLAGMPIDYYRYVYVFEDETVDGFYKKLFEVSEYDEERLRIKGIMARDYILENKNNIIQTKRIIDFIQQL